VYYRYTPRYYTLGFRTLYAYINVVRSNPFTGNGVLNLQGYNEIPIEGQKKNQEEIQKKIQKKKIQNKNQEEIQKKIQERNKIKKDKENKEIK